MKKEITTDQHDIELKLCQDRLDYVLKFTNSLMTCLDRKENEESRLQLVKDKLILD